MPTGAIVATPAQALCDFVYMMRREGLSPEGLVTFRNLAEHVTTELDAILDRYPIAVQQHVLALVAGGPRGVGHARSTRQP